jgi:general nucleoside transport system permease protein
MRSALASLLCVAFASLLCFALLALTQGLGLSLQAVGALFQGAVGDVGQASAQGDAALVLRPLGESLNKAALLLLTGLSVAAAFRVGLFNIGASGQFMVGALLAALVGAHLTAPGVIHLTVAFVAAGLGGALWALVPALLKTKRGVHEVISTIMMNWVAQSLIENWLVVGPLRAQASGSNSISGTAQIADSARLPLVLGEVSRLHIGLGVALASGLAVWFFFTRTVRGFQWKVQGLSPRAALAAGMPSTRLTLEGMLLSGLLAGFAGAVLVLGTEYKYPPVLSSGYGFDGIAMALVGQSHPLGVMLASLFFGAIRAGGTRLQLLGIHKSFPELIQGVALLMVAGKIVFERLLRPRNEGR